ncbi:hypothetical protein COF68_05025 [Bacillus toyonensis]|uniref:hypothetical protein n=1 Tax=Bacillus toyonensis TaxID=155322 RepID=UPI000BFDE9F8|nr:hypothetical protein [Bacillus toyonensis]PHE64210.1 hypothetical protein COF68_05025 [Bacillus toyonensis]
MSTKPKDNNSLYNLVWEKMTRGVTAKLDSQEATMIDKWSPNNIRRLIVSPEGVVFQLFVTEGTFYKNPIGIVPFPFEESTHYALEKGYPITSVLYRDRVFSSVEEVIILPKSPVVPYSLSSREFSTLQNKVSSLKRLANIVVVAEPVSLKDFVERNIQVLGDRYQLLTENKDAYLGNNQAVPFVKDWYNHTSLRPQYYSLDEPNKKLHKYFQDVKENNPNKPSNKTSSRSKAKPEEKVEEKKSNAKLTKVTKHLLFSRCIQLGVVEENNARVTAIKTFNSPIKHNEEAKFQVHDDDKSNKVLESLGLYSKTGSTDYDKLNELLMVDIVLTARNTARQVSGHYPVFGEYLTRLLKKLTPKDKEANQQNAELIRKLVRYDYRKPLDESIVFSNLNVSEQDKERLTKGIANGTESIQDVEKLILFDVGVDKKIQGSELLVLHDLFIYENNIEHRTYNSLYKPESTEVKGHVLDQSIGERIKLILKGVPDDSQEEVSEEDNLDSQTDNLEESADLNEEDTNEDEFNELDEQEWGLCQQYVEEINNSPHWNVWNTLHEEMKRELKQLISSNPSNKQKAIAGFFIDMVNTYQISGTNKAGTMAHCINMMIKHNYLSDSNKLGGKGYRLDRFAKRIISEDQPLNENYSIYLFILKEMMIMKRWVRQ